MPPGTSQKGAANKTPEKNKIVPDMQTPEVAGSEEWQRFHKHTQYSVAQLGNCSGNTILIPLQKNDIEVKVFWVQIDSCFLKFVAEMHVSHFFGALAPGWALWDSCSGAWAPRALSLLGSGVCSLQICLTMVQHHSFPQDHFRAEDRILPGSPATINLGRPHWDPILNLKKVCLLWET